MMRRLVLVLIAGILGVALATGCREGEEDDGQNGGDPPTPAPSELPTAAASPSPTATEVGRGGGGDLEGTVIPAPSPGPDASTTPQDWPNYQSPRFKVSYPDRFTIANATDNELILQSWDKDAWDGPGFPPKATKLDVIQASRDTIDDRPTGASDLLVGDIPGWYVAYEYDPDKSGGVSYVLHAVLMDGSSAASIAEVFIGTPWDADEFWYVVGSFRFGGGGG